MIYNQTYRKYRRRYDKKKGKGFQIQIQSGSEDEHDLEKAGGNQKYDFNIPGW